MATSIPANVRAEMARRGRPQTDIAQALGISQAAVSRRLNGEVDFSATELTTLAREFEIQVSVFFGEVAA